MSIDEIAEKLMSEPFMTPGWSQEDLFLWLRDGCRCVYCDRDMLESYDTLFYQSGYDHLLPQKDYPGLVNCKWNKVLACRPCNTIKHTFDPSRRVANPKLYSADSPPNESERLELIARAKEYIEQMGSQCRANFPKQKSLIVKYLRPSESRSMAATA